MALPPPTPEQLGKIVGPLIAPTGPFTIARDDRGLYFPKAYQTLAEFFTKSVDEHKNKTFIVYENERYSFGDALEIAVNLGTYLKEKHGVGRGKHVAVAMRNYPEWCFSFMAVTLIGGVVVPLNGWWEEAELEYGLKDSESTVLICDEERFARAYPAVKRFGIPTILVRSGHPVAEGATLFEEVIAEAKKIRAASPNIKFDVNENSDAALLMYTSGSTGHPKGVVLTHKGILNQMEVARFSQRVQEDYLKLLNIPPPVLPYQFCIICPVPLFHVTASHHIFLASFLVGRKLVLMYKWDTAKTLELIEKERATNWTGVPTMLQDLMLHPNFSKTDTSSLIAVGSGGAPTPPSSVPKLLSHFSKAIPTNGYGLTETNGAVAWNMGANYIAKPTSCGAPFPIMEAKVVDPETGEDLGRNKPGELLFRGALIMKEYWKRPDATLEALSADGWFNTKDVAEIDNEGFIYIVDRAKDIIIRGGENIACAEVETAFYSHPAVRECAAFSLPHERLGEVVGLLVYFHDGQKATPEELVQHVRGKLASFKIPDAKAIFITSEALPRGATGKINKKLIKETIRKQLQGKAKL